MNGFFATSLERRTGELRWKLSGTSTRIVFGIFTCHWTFRRLSLIPEPATSDYDCRALGGLSDSSSAPSVVSIAILRFWIFQHRLDGIPD